MSSPTKRGGKRILAVAATIGLLTTAFTTPAMAATLSAGTLDSSVSGNSVTVRTTISTTDGLTATRAGVCIRDESGDNFDLKNSGVWLSESGTTITKTGQFDAGTYRYWSCAKIDGAWQDLGAAKTFTVSGGGGAATASGQAMPVGDLPNFKQVFKDDFTTDLARGSFPGSYRSKWASYSGFGDTLGGGVYNKDIISMGDGMMDLYLHKANGKGQVAAPVPLINGDWNSQTYGKYTIRFKSDALPGFRTAWLLWPTSGNWKEGEIDFPEGGLAGEMWGFNHCIGNPSVNCGWVNTGKSFTGWHTASVEWTPSSVVFLMDGEKVMTSTNAVPRTPMRWILQTESGTTNPDRMTTNGHLQIDWVTMYDYTG
ncbi:glycoside hydrolase family 16 protein [Nakamurella deserti]|uniref:glycoside hydrolase family 16 protein n=1 Tax=Nakamurella deserti TaxID=2164074 RepID=UPI000DBE58F9|nr:glycoside hydrolase family 16 protein [Nakamurella deserti]